MISLTLGLSQKREFAHQFEKIFPKNAKKKDMIPIQTNLDFGDTKSVKKNQSLLPKICNHVSDTSIAVLLRVFLVRYELLSFCL